MIDKLTPAQEAKIPEYVAKYHAVLLDTTPVDRSKAEAAIKAAYRYLKHPEPRIYWEPSPEAGRRKTAELVYNTSNPTTAQIEEMRKHTSYGRFEAYWVAFYAFIARELPVKSDPLVDIADELCRNVGAYWALDQAVVMTDAPVAIHLDANNKLHNVHGLALEYPDGTGVYALNGKKYRSLLDKAINEDLENAAS